MVSPITVTTVLNPNKEMTDFDYKKYSLQQLENFLHDAMSAAEATPQEIYDVIVNVVKENYYTYKKQASQAYELLALLNNGVAENKYQDYLNKTLSCDKDNPWYDFWEQNYYPEEHKASISGDWSIHPAKDKVVKWQLPVEVDGLTGDCYINLPDDLLESANLKEGDTVKWVDNKNGTYTMVKTTESLGMDEC